MNDEKYILRKNSSGHVVLMKNRFSGQIELTFNKDCMTVSDLKKAANTLEGILEYFDEFSDNPEEFVLRVLQVRNLYKLRNQE